MKSFNTKEEAIEYMCRKVNSIKIINFRFADANIEREVIDYKNRKKIKGGLHSFDAKVIIKNKKYLIGCNYGN